MSDESPNIVRFCIVNPYDGGVELLGEYDMTDWDEGYKKVWADAEAKGTDFECNSVVLFDSATDLYWNLRRLLQREGYLTKEDDE